MIPPALEYLLVGAAGSLLMAILGYLTVRVQGMTAELKDHEGKLNGALTALKTTVGENKAALAVLVSDAKSGAGAVVTPAKALVVPLYNQHDDPNPDGLADLYASTDCGWESCCVVARACRGIAVSQGDARTQIGGPTRPGISNGQVLAQLLTFWHFAPIVHNGDGADALLVITGALEAGHPLVCLGYWIAPTFLHWVVIVGRTPTEVTYEDPWYGRIITISRDDFLAKYQGVVIDVGEPTRY